MLKGKLWVVAPHPDDEILGCYNLMKKFKGEVYISYLSTGEPGESFDDFGVSYSSDFKNSLSSSVKKWTKAKEISFPVSSIKDSQFNIFPESALVDKLWDMALRIHPNVIAIPSFSDRNQDHLITSRAVMSAIRPPKLSSLNMLLGYNTLSSSEWPDGVSNMFRPNSHTPMSINDMNLKVDVMRAIYPEIMLGMSINEERMRLVSRYWAAHLGYCAHCEPYEIYYQTL